MATVQDEDAKWGDTWNFSYQFDVDNGDGTTSPYDFTNSEIDVILVWPTGRIIKKSTTGAVTISGAIVSGKFSPTEMQFPPGRTVRREVKRILTASGDVETLLEGYLNVDDSL